MGARLGDGAACRSQPMATWQFLLVLLAGFTWHATDGFKVICSSYLIQVQVGSQVVLECQVTPVLQMKMKEIRWTKEGALVHLYRFGQDENDQQDASFQGRTHLFSKNFAQGNVSLLLQNVHLLDRGIFNCFVEFESNLNHDSSVKLGVLSLGELPSVNLLEYTEDGVRLVCDSQRWYPQPTVVWRLGHGGEVSRQPVTTSEQNAKSFFSVKSIVEVTTHSGSDYQCLITGADAKQSVSTNFHVPDEFFPRTSKWMGGFVVIFLAVVASLVGLGLLNRWLQRHIRDLEKRPTSSEYQRLQMKQEALKKELDTLHDELGRIRILPTAGMDRIRNAAVAVTLDPNTAHPMLQVSPDLVTVRCVKGRAITSVDGGVSEPVLSVMGKPPLRDEEGITSGRCYWVVEVGSNSEWDLGVASNDAEKRARTTLRPEGGVWSIGCHQKVFRVNDANSKQISIHPATQEKIQMIGVYLDYGEGKVLFCDDSTGSHLHSFSDCTFKGGLLPFFNVSASGNALTICPVVHVA
ncbi:butyrophilin subfamily 1 member A1-like [Amblyraja radiata]|uniref:butyrophilin subfamily 1 member A1-like n=1 Tax=Amblyraja radiata TaxID=386614 RepID=UPI001403E961|nr:butyrophilin subfamily 1 member A1-like [Amblyraja radiata]